MSLPLVAAAQDSAVVPQRILINYQHMGWDSINERFVLQRHADGSGYEMHARYESRTHVAKDLRLHVDAGTARALVDALIAPPWPRDRGVRAVASRYSRRQLMPKEFWPTRPPSPCSVETQRVLGGQYVKNRGTVALVDDLYGENGGVSWTDDYPFAVVQLLWPDGSVQTLHSRSQKAMMLPWVTGVPEVEAQAAKENWSVTASDQLRALLPSDSYLHARLDGLEAMARRIRERVSYAVSRQCDASMSNSMRSR
ncbi:hypothetical protein LR961_16045 [Stenotrophomonas sp. SY1]|nr:hypothetical protein [Stenotrophomonas sp. SY1]